MIRTECKTWGPVESLEVGGGAADCLYAGNNQKNGIANGTEGHDAIARLRSSEPKGEANHPVYSLVSVVGLRIEHPDVKDCVALRPPFLSRS